MTKEMKTIYARRELFKAGQRLTLCLSMHNSEEEEEEDERKKHRESCEKKQTIISIVAIVASWYAEFFFHSL